MDPYQQRVMDEYRELGDKVTKLSAFLASTTKPILTTGELSRLKVQLSIMGAYREILASRIDAFGS